MADTTVTVETPEDGEGESAANQDGNGHETAQAHATVEASTAAAENKAHAEHAAATATDAAQEAKDHKQMAEWSSESASQALESMAGIASNIVSAVESIPDKIVSALSSLAPQGSTDNGPDLEVEAEPLPPATPPSRRKFRDFYYGNAKGGK
jgi:hypothetical protein